MGTQHSRKPGCKLVYLAVYRSPLLNSRGGKDMLKGREMWLQRKLGGEGVRGKNGRRRAPVDFKLPLTIFFLCNLFFTLSGISLKEDRRKLIFHKLQPRPKANFVLLRPAQGALQGRRWGTGLPSGLLFTVVSLWVSRLRKFSYKALWFKYKS